MITPLKTAVVAGLLCFCLSMAAVASEPISWWKGNLHTHTLWSDGDDYPEMVVEWYKTNGYHFLVLSDHNITQQGDKWIGLGTNKTAAIALNKYLERYPNVINRIRSTNGTEMIRLKTLQEFRGAFEELDHFLLMMGEEISAKAGKIPVHIGAVNMRKPIAPIDGATVLDVMQRNINAVLEQRKAIGKRIFPHVNHPNFEWAITAEDLMQIHGDRFVEIYNGHPAVRNEGDATHVDVERMWDITLAFRLARLNLPVLYGIAVDDSHSYHSMSITNANPGRGWVMVRALRLLPDEIVTALEAGDFYASTGVRLIEITPGRESLSLKIDSAPGIDYITYFIGTRRHFNEASEPVQTTNGLAATRSYSAEIGELLGKSPGANPSYSYRGDELYVRAKIFSTKPKFNGYAANEVEVAWTQPVIPPKRLAAPVPPPH